MKKYLIVFLFIFSASFSHADGLGVVVTSDGVAFPSGIDTANTKDFDSAIGGVTVAHGVDESGSGVDSCKIVKHPTEEALLTVEAACHIHIKGPHYFFNATTINPDLGAGENSKFIGVTMNGYTTSESAWTTDQKLTVIPLARVNTAYGVSGPGSTISLIRDDRYYFSKRGFYDRIVWELIIGAQYVTGGKIYESSGLTLGQTSGILFDAQTKEQSLSAFTNMSAVFLHLSSNETNWVGVKKPLVIDNINYNPAGSSLVPMLNDNKFKIDTVLKSPKGANGDTPEGGFFLIAGSVEYATQADAIAAIVAGTAIRWGLFQNQAVSGLVPVALIIQQKSAVAIDTVSDVRPCFVCRPQ